jgi:predicted PurR-regulated permease PerM
MLAVVAFCALIPLLYLGAGYVVPVIAAIVASLVLGPLQGRLVSSGLPTWLAALLLVVLFLALGAALTLVTAGSFARWANELPRIGLALQGLMTDVRALLVDLQDAGAALEEATGVDPVGESGPLPGIVGTLVSALALQTPVFLGQLVVFIALLFFLLESRLRMRAGLLRLCMTRVARLRAAHIFRDAEARVSTYLLTITAINAALGLATSFVMWAIGLPNPLLWGLLAFLLNYAPYLGPGVLIVLLVGAGLVSFDDQGWAFLPALAFFALNALEANFLTPGIVGSQLKIEPAILIVTLVLLFGLWGIAGAALAIPLLLIAQAVLQHTVLGNTR